jgi:tRNA-dihydrouridine synthase
MTSLLNVLLPPPAQHAGNAEQHLEHLVADEVMVGRLAVASPGASKQDRRGRNGDCDGYCCRNGCRPRFPFHVASLPQGSIPRRLSFPSSVPATHEPVTQSLLIAYICDLLIHRGQGRIKPSAPSVPSD